MDASFQGLSRQQLHALAADPRTDGATLAKLVQVGPEFWPIVAAHQNAYPELLGWLQNTGDPATATILRDRMGRAAAPPSNGKKRNTLPKVALIGVGVLAVAVIAGVVAVAAQFIGGEKSSQSSVAESDGFTIGAQELWTLSSEQMWGTDGGDAAVVPTAMALQAADTLLFSTYDQIKAIGPVTGKTLWTQDNIGPITHCALDEREEVLYCPSFEGTDSIQALDVKNGKVENIQLTATSAKGVGYVDDMQLGGGGLILYQADLVSAVDFDGTIKWQTPIETQYSENRYMMINDHTILIEEPPAAIGTQLSLTDGKILYSGDTSGAPVFDLPGVDRAVVVDGGACNYELQGVVLHAPADCEYGDGGGLATAYDDVTGEPLWELQLGGRVLQKGSGRYLVVVSGMHQVGTKHMQAFDSVTVYGPAADGEPTSSSDVRPGATQAEVATEPGGAGQVPAIIPDCPDSTVLLAWAELSNGWVLVCGVSASQPTYWASEFADSGMQTSSDVQYVPAATASTGATSEGYVAHMSGGESLRLDYQPAGVTRLDRSDSVTGQFKVLIIFFVELGERQVPAGEAPAVPSTVVAGSEAPASTPSQESSAQTGSHPSTAYCPAGGYTQLEGVTEGFYITICGNSGAGFTYVGLGKNGGLMVLPAKFYDGLWVAENESHSYGVTESQLMVVELATNNRIVDQALTPIR